MSDYELKRSISDIQARIASLNAIVRRAAGPSPHRMLSRVMACHVLGRHKSRGPEAIADEIYRNDAAVMCAWPHLARSARPRWHRRKPR